MRWQLRLLRLILGTSCSIAGTESTRIVNVGKFACSLGCAQMNTVTCEVTVYCDLPVLLATHLLAIM